MNKFEWFMACCIAFCLIMAGVFGMLDKPQYVGAYFSAAAVALLAIGASNL